MSAKRRKNNLPKRATRASAQDTTSGLGMKGYILIVGAVALALAVVSGLVIFDQGGRLASQPKTLSGEISLDKSTGADDAPVVVVEFGDFQ